MAGLTPSFQASLCCPKERSALVCIELSNLEPCLDAETFRRMREWEAAMVRRDGALLYPIRGGIPVLLWEERLEIKEGCRPELVKAFESAKSKLKT